MDRDQIQKEFHFKAVASSGAGGHHVNKVATKVQLYFDVLNSLAFAKAEHSRIIARLNNRLTNDGVLILSDQSSRSQATNKERVIQSLFALLEEARKPIKARKKTGIPKAVKRKRLEAKRRKSEKKNNRNYRYEG
ncbi:aminoacyl-tRNA hydrolase [Nonlabens spongiae]|uniref:Aminoacyl-tRNA hydrolase n=1 Tax=Nonlabens spongiae TaxID=331648 RepID=A0A1W6MLG1_9FLAO|nr:alternative ribosome rescue aminoacyl-tRNA hydrolase ArfB [Nonlabens spongiae]ARN78438.1 aminoacyl-tRNA hydrolase [Nonlabens spongiae]